MEADESLREIRGRLMSARDGGPPPHALIAAVALSTLEQADPDAPAPIEAGVRPATDGAFVLPLVESLLRAEDIVLFTVSPFYRCEVYRGARLGPGCPTARELLAVAYRAAALSLDHEITLSLQPVVEHEPWTEFVQMSDGVRLATEIFLPDGSGPWPVVLARTPYGRLAFDQYAAQFLQLGYACVIQDMRGRFDSEGEDMPFAACGWGEHRDGYETVEWIAAQPWCNGRVATCGGSAMAITQYLLGPSAPPHLVCMVAIVGTPSLFHHAEYPGGLFRREQIEEWLRQNGFSQESWEAIHSHYLYDDFQRRYDAMRVDVAARVQVPTFHIGGWYDTFQQGTLDAFIAWQHHGGEGARGRQRLLIGPWAHAIGGREVGDLTWPENAEIDWMAEAVRFLDHHMKGHDTGIEREPPVRYYLMGPVGEAGAPGCRWCTADDWPPPADETPWYLHSTGELLPEPPDDEDGEATLRHDPYDPVPSLGGFNLYIRSGPVDQRPAEQRTDVLVWTSPPLDEAVEVVGRVRARLWVSSDCFDADIIVKLCDVYPDGRSILVTYGGLRLRFRNGQHREDLLTPGEVYCIDVDMWSTAYVFARGHSIRVDVQSSDFPHFDINPGTGEPLHQHTHALPALNTVHMSRETPSCVILPVRTGGTRTTEGL
ncbi:MAG: CocE/NonD family hydrolase [Armatimonadetes bacterium]|nr:CocE/NonD family hydrolase [Armatimonadota bacterium]